MLLEKIKKALVPEIADNWALPAPGLRHFERQVKDKPVRYHLRVDSDGSGLLIANAAAACRLSPTGVVIAEGLLSRAEHKDIKKRLQKTFSGADERTISNDLERVQKTLDDMAFPGSRYPLMNLDDPAATARARALSAPLLAEIGVDGTGDILARIDKLWDVAVPQVILIHLPGAPADLLVAGVERAEDHGLIAGVRAPASALLEDDLLDRLVQAGLDHVDVYWTGADASRHDALFGSGDHVAAVKVFERCRELELCSVAVVPIVAGSIEGLEAALSVLPGLGVEAVTVFALAQAELAESSGGLPPGALRQAAVVAEEVCDALHLNLVFAPPVEREMSQSVESQLRRGPRTAGEASIRVTPDGSVIPPHGPRRSVGNLLSQPFDEIWKHSAFEHLRESVSESERCDGCPGLVSCAAGCIASPEYWARLETMEER